jgi:hypothetical protein
LRSIVKRLMLLALFATILGSAIECERVMAPIGGSVLVVPSIATPTLTSAVAIANQNDEVHVLAGHFEALGANLFISQNNLWIIGAPPTSGPKPNIDLKGFTIIITGANVFIWGLNITDTVGGPFGMVLLPPSTGCIVMNNTMTGIIPASTGIQVLSSANLVAMNTMSFWGTCIDLAGPTSANNNVKGNTLNAPYNTGIQVSGGAAFNNVYWNNLMSPGEFLDANPPASPPNFFDDTTGGGPSLTKGNFEITYMPPPPFVVPGPNAYVDNWPLAVPCAIMKGDFDLNGRIGLTDLVMLANSYGKQWCNLRWDPRCDAASPWGGHRVNRLSYTRERLEQSRSLNLIAYLPKLSLILSS